ncbi:hypothetical protein [Nonomuraea dietziae]|uniref:Uncharacterized protein n=1 Tax=Nonomuraea dietziae TaxID=65515 RepID=A0A7W5V4V7_9ACTN|nr:hypothetical protein [Nonomuraea dietziae]MBB3725584.1 hypothetical protein [Nonomuraea dietziae]
MAWVLLGHADPAPRDGMTNPHLTGSVTPWPKVRYDLARRVRKLS